MDHNNFDPSDFFESAAAKPGSRELMEKIIEYFGTQKISSMSLDQLRHAWPSMLEQAMNDPGGPVDNQALELLRESSVLYQNDGLGGVGGLAFHALAKRLSR